MDCLGNKELLKREKVGFLCSRNISSGCVFRCYDWALEMKNSGKVVVSGFHSKIEKDVFRILARGTQPIIVVLARRHYTQQYFPEEFKQPLADGRLLIVSTDSTARFNTVATAAVRNRYICQISEQMVFGYLSEQSNLKSLYDEFAAKSSLLFE